MNHIARGTFERFSYRKNPSLGSVEYDLECSRPVGNQGEVVAEGALLKTMVILRNGNL